MKTETNEQQAIMNRLGAKLARMRDERGMSIRDFADVLGVESSLYFRLETAATPNPSIFTIQTIARSLGMTVDKLMNFDATTCPTCRGMGYVVLEHITEQEVKA